MNAPVPAEWSPHRALWIGFPSHAELWEDDLAPAQQEVAALVRALAGPGAERVRLLVCGEAGEAAATALLGGEDGVEIVSGQFGDIWLRDTGPIFFGPGRAAAFRFNGWGGKYVLSGDEAVADQLACHARARLERHDAVLEGGALDHDGAGTVLTTRECLTNPNRNRSWTEAVAEAALADTLGVRKTIWLGQGLLNDHTDGHVDNLARFVAPGVAAIPIAMGADDPHARIYNDAARTLAGARDAAGRTLRVMRIPSPGRVVGADNIAAPASHMNFIIANRAVVFPTYNAGPAEFAKAALEAIFPDRQIIGLPSRALLTGGGSFHCISQQEPA
ncbi:MAG TPA: agmatine deiminase family protein [Caulobacteraceae bacterium]|nr:agmatine deiminase family protein [Caulobacteraceae bacterium]